MRKCMRGAYTHHGCRDTAVATLFRLAAEHDVAPTPSAVNTQQRRSAASNVQPRVQAQPSRCMCVCVASGRRPRKYTGAPQRHSKVLVGTRRLVRGGYTTRLSTVRTSVRHTEQAAGRHALPSAATRAIRWWCREGWTQCVLCGTATRSASWVHIAPSLSGRVRMSGGTTMACP